MKYRIIYLPWVRISILCIIVMITAVLVSRQPEVEKFVKKIITPALTSTEKDWSLELDKSYSLCRHNESLRNSYPSLKELQAAIVGNQGYQLKRITGHSYVYGISVRDYCLNCRNNQFLGVNEQNVVVIRGTPEKPGPVQEQTSIKTDALPQLELNDLRKGIPFKNGNEKLQLIEGLKGLSAN